MFRKIPLLKHEIYISKRHYIAIYVCLSHVVIHILGFFIKKIVKNEVLEDLLLNCIDLLNISIFAILVVLGLAFY